MFNPEQRDGGKPPRSLLSLGQGVQKAAAAPTSASIVSLVPDGPSPAERHRLARSRRDAAPNPILGALARKPAAPAREPSQRAEPALAEQPRRQHVPLDIPSTTRTPTPTPAATPAPVAAARTGYSGLPHVAGGDEWRPLIDPWKIWGGIVRSRWIILASTVAGAMLGIAVALSTPKKYESVAELLVDPRDIKVSERNVTEGGLPSDATLAIVENQVRVLTSGNVLSKVVDKLNLAADTEFNGQESSFGIRALVSEVRSMLSRSEGGEGDVRRALAIRNLAESLSVERGGKTFVVNIAAKTKSPEKSALIANTLISAFLDSYGELQSDTAGRASDELTARLSELQKGVEEAERQVETFKAERDLIDAQGRLITDDEIVKLNEQLTIARARTIELNARAASARGLDPDAVIGGNLPEQISSPLMAELRTQYATSKQEVERISVRLGPRHPERMAAEAQLAGARDSLASELRRIGASIQIDLKRAVQLEQDLASRLAQLKSRQGTVSDDLVTLRELEREGAARRAVYENFLLRARETDEQRGINTANMSVISVAQPPLDPLGPSRAVIAIAGTMLGFMAGIGIGGARGAIDSLRGEGGGGVPAGPSRPNAPVAARGTRDDEIDRIMRAAASGWTDDPDREAARQPSAGPLEPASKPGQAKSAAAAAPTAPDTPKENAMHPPYNHPVAPPPAAYPAQPWMDAQAAYAAHQQAAYQAWLAAQQQPYAAPAAYPQSAQGAPYWPYPAHAQPIYPQPQMPMNMQAPPPWPGQPQFAYPPAWPSAPEPGFRPHPQPQQQASHRAPRPEPSAMDEIRDSLREFREALRDLADARSRSRG